VKQVNELTLAEVDAKLALVRDEMGNCNIGDLALLLFLELQLKRRRDEIVAQAN